MVGTPLIRINSDDGYVDRLVKLVPAEAVSAYLALINVAGASANTVNGAISPDNVTAGTTAVASASGNPAEVYWAFIIALGILAVARILGSTTVGGKRTIDLTAVDWIMVVISIAAYALWVYTIGGNTSGPFKDYYSLFWGTAFIILFTFLAPYIHTSGTRVAGRIHGRTVP
jgi:hypothetical protein